MCGWMFGRQHTCMHAALCAQRGPSRGRGRAPASRCSAVRCDARSAPITTGGTEARWAHTGPWSLVLGSTRMRLLLGMAGRPRAFNPCGRHACLAPTHTRAAAAPLAPFCHSAIVPCPQTPVVCRLLAAVLLLEAVTAWPFWAWYWPSWYYRAHVRLHFFTNVAVAGGLVLLQALGAGEYTVDRLLGRKQE